jgi:hypothetical protein
MVLQWRLPSDTYLPSGFFLPGKADAHQFQRNFEKILSSLPTTLLVCSSGKADLLA